MKSFWWKSRGYHLTRGRVSCQSQSVIGFVTKKNQKIQKSKNQTAVFLRWYAFLCSCDYDVLYTNDLLRNTLFYQNAHHDWLTKVHFTKLVSRDYIVIFTVNIVILCNCSDFFFYCSINIFINSKVVHRRWINKTSKNKSYHKTSLVDIDGVVSMAYPCKQIAGTRHWEMLVDGPNIYHHLTELYNSTRWYIYLYKHFRADFQPWQF